MYRIFAAAVATTIGLGGSALANGGQCFDKGGLRAVDCPSGWEGPYAGVSVGVRQDDFELDNPRYSFLGGVALPPPGPSANSAELSEVGVRGGLFAGYDFQADNSFVFGFEADIGFADVTDDEAIRVGGDSSNNLTTIESSFDAGLRLRAGVLATDSVLLYATGGLAILDVEVEHFCGGGACNPAVPTTRTDDELLLGYSVGGGVQFKVSDNWFMRGEYRYADYGEVEVDIVSANANSTFNTKVDVETESHISLLGFGYQF